MRDYYQILGVAPSASEQQIRNAYHSLSAELDPDRPEVARNRSLWVEASHRLKEIKRAYAVLSDEQRRLKYDRRPGVGQPTIIPPAPPSPGDFNQDFGAMRRVGPRGVGGLLKLFCVILTAIVPPLWLIVMLREWLEMGGAHGPRPDEMVGFAGTLLLTQVLRSAFVVYGFVVGTEILANSDRGRFFAKRFLMHCAVGMTVLQMGVFSVFSSADIIRLGPLPVYELAGGLLVAVFCLIWGLYFTASRRVRNTYGPEHRRAGGEFSLAAHRQRRIAELRRREICVVCGYDMRATPDRCPECGTRVPPPPEISIEIPQPPPR